MYEDFKDLVEINKIRNHFIFSIESTGALSCSDLMIQSVNILMAKSHSLLNEINRNKI
jgi:DNA-directed RNA polymerase I and III subunit RPAC1